VSTGSQASAVASGLPQQQTSSSSSRTMEGRSVSGGEASAVASGFPQRQTSSSSSRTIQGRLVSGGDSSHSDDGSTATLPPCIFPAALDGMTQSWPITPKTRQTPAATWDIADDILESKQGWLANRPITRKEFFEARTPSPLNMEEFPRIFRRATDKPQETHYAYFNRLGLEEDAHQRRKALERRSVSQRQTMVFDGSRETSWTLSSIPTDDKSIEMPPWQSERAEPSPRTSAAPLRIARNQQAVPTGQPALASLSSPRSLSRRITSGDSSEPIIKQRSMPAALPRSARH